MPTIGATADLWKSLLKGPDLIWKSFYANFTSGRRTRWWRQWKPLGLLPRVPIVGSGWDNDGCIYNPQSNICTLTTSPLSTDATSSGTMAKPLAKDIEVRMPEPWGPVVRA